MLEIPALEILLSDRCWRSGLPLIDRIFIALGQSFCRKFNCSDDNGIGIMATMPAVMDTSMLYRAAMCLLQSVAAQLH